MQSPAPPRLRKRFVAALAAVLLLPALPVRRIVRHAVSRARPARASSTTDELVADVVKGVAAAKRAWPGYEPFDQPLLLAFERRGSFVLGAPEAPRGFARGGGGLVPAWTSRRAFTPSFSYVDEFDLNGSTMTALRLPEPVNATYSAKFYIHERFHYHQHMRFKNPILELYMVEEPRDVALAWLENQSLADWVERADPESMRDFAAVRARRGRLFPGSSAELTEERIEGTAKFVELAAEEAFASSAPARRYLLSNLRAPPSLESLRKWRSYEIGAALCRWLDAEKASDWRAAVEAGRSPSELVLARLAMGEPEISRRVDRLTARPAFANGLRRAAADIERVSTVRADWLKEYNALPGRRLVLTSTAARAGFSGNWIEYPDRSSMIVTSEWVSEHPGIRVRLKGKTVVRRGPEAEFVLPPDAVLTLDGGRFAVAPGRRPFRSLKISQALIELDAGPGVLDDDGRVVRLTMDPP